MTPKPGFTMAHKRKAEEFFYTLSDEEDAPALETEAAAPTGPPKKRNKKDTAQPRDEDDDLASDFEFFDGGIGFGAEDASGQDMEWAGGKTGIDLNEMIKTKRESKAAKNARLSKAVADDGEE